MNAFNPSPPDLFFGNFLTIRHFMTPRRLLAGSAAVLLIGLVSLAAQSASADKSAGPPSSQQTGADQPTSAADVAPQSLIVEVEPAQASDSFRIARTYTGLVVASRTSQLGFERSARVILLRVDEGDVVSKGDVLAVLDARQLETERQRLESQRDQAAAVLAELKSGPRLETIAAAKAEVMDWAAQVELQQRNYARTSELVRQNAVSRESNDAAELGVQSLKAKLDAAQRRLDELQAGTRQEQIDAQQAVVRQLVASLADMAIEIENSTLLAPFNGKISQRHVDEGTVVSPAQPIYEIVETGQLELQVGLPPRVFNHLVPGQKVEVEVGERKWSASFDRAAAIVDLRTRTRTAIFELDPSASAIVVPGEVARVSFDESTSADGFWVPTRALIRSTRGLWAVYVAEPLQHSDRETARDTAIVARRDVEILHTDAERSFVRGLIQPGDRIIVSGTQRVVPDQRVRASPPPNRRFPRR